MRLAYADPPYVGQSRKHYAGHEDYAGEVDHRALLERLAGEYDGWALSCSSSSLQQLLPLAPEGVRVLAWCKPFAVYKRGVGLAYAWEPVLLWPARRRDGPEVVGGTPVVQDWLSCPITMRRGLVGVKPAAVLHWLFECLGAERSDTLDDLYPGSGAAGRAWERWCATPPLPSPNPAPATTEALA